MTGKLCNRVFGPGRLAMGGEEDGKVRWCPPNRTVGSLGSDVRFDFF
jgi:hypothetical protein